MVLYVGSIDFETAFLNAVDLLFAADFRVRRFFLAEELEFALHTLHQHIWTYLKISFNFTSRNSRILTQRTTYCYAHIGMIHHQLQIRHFLSSLWTDFF